MTADDIAREMVEPYVNTALAAYLECALWAETSDGEDGSLGLSWDYLNYDLDDIADRSHVCARVWVTDALRYVATERPIDVWPAVAANPAQFGHDFWLTRNRHGAGFWDGGWSYGDYLTEMAHSYGSDYLYRGDDEKLHFGDEGPWTA